MRNIILAFFLLFFTIFANAQTFQTLKIGNSAPINASAILEVQGTTGALLFPRMTTTQKNAIASPTNGELVYDTTLNAFSGYQSGSWTPVGGAAAWGFITGTLSSQTDLQNALNLKANLASPTFTGTVTAPTFVGALTGNASTATSATSATTAGNITGTSNSTLTTLSALSLPATQVTGLAAAVGATSSPTANTISEWDANKNFSANALFSGYATTATAAGTTTLVITSTQFQVFTGTTTQIVKLPTTSVVAGVKYFISNLSTGVVSVQSSAGTAMQAMAANTVLEVTANSSAPTAPTGWNSVYYSIGTVPIALGGTGQVTAALAFQGLSPLTTKGDTLVFSTSDIRQAVPGDYGSLVPDVAQASGWRSATYTATDGKLIKNYVQYADFENAATTGWTLGTVGTLTNKLPTGTPTFGSGAAGALSISASATTPISGSDSLLYVSSAATTLGNMVASSPLTIDSSDQAKVLTFSFNYLAKVGASVSNYSGGSTNSYGVALWDATNSQWLSTAGNFCMIQNSGVGKCVGTFQTNKTTASIRLAIYNANATTGASTLALDDFYLGPQIIPQGFAGSDWNPYTVTITSTGTQPSVGVATSNAYWRRVGDSVEISYVFAQSSGGSVGTGNYLWNLPSGLSVDTSKASFGSGSSGNGGTTVGNGVVANSLSGASSAVTVVYPVNSTHLGMSAAYTSTDVEPVGPQFQLTGTVWYQFNAKVPITGWSSNTAMSSDTDTRVVAAAYNTLASLSNTANAPFLFTIESIDTHGAYNTSTGIYTVPVTGNYFISVVTPVTGALNVILYRNGSALIPFGLASGVKSTSSILYPFSAGDQIYVGTDGTSPFSDNSGIFSINRLSGPATIAASESVNMLWTLTTAAAVNGSGYVVMDTKQFDSHNAYSPATGLYTVPISGKYRFSFTSNSATAPNMHVYKNGADFIFIGTSSASIVATGSTTVPCLAGDTLALYAGGGTFAGTSGGVPLTSLSIERIGN